ncbi:MAG: hypothetical protein K0S08_1043 [Gammaproteobacteria bacterium]|jgi:hypothetical protein|nr:hypothetical protein [Gammaproteobacteria bacterium]
MFSRVYASLIGMFFIFVFALSFADSIPPVLVEADPNLSNATMGNGETNLSYCNAEKGVYSECLESSISSASIFRGETKSFIVDGVVGGEKNGIEFSAYPITPIWPLDDGCLVDSFHVSGWVQAGGELYITDTRDPKIPVKFIVCASKQANGDIHLTEEQMAKFKAFYEKNKDKFLHPMRQDKR